MENEPKHSQGLFAQMSKVEVHRSEITYDDLKNYFERLQKLRNAYSKKKEDTIRSNIKHLEKRSVELKKEIPMELLLMVQYIYPLFVSKEFREKYKEWIN